MLNNIDTTYTEVLAHALLRMPDGPAFSQAVTDLHAFLRDTGENGHTAMFGSIRERFIDTFQADMREFAAANKDENILRVLSIIDRFHGLWSDLMDRSLRASPATTEERLRITQCIEFLSKAKTEDEIAAHMEELESILFRQEDKTLLVMGKWQVELLLTRLLIDAYEEQLRPMKTTYRGIALFHFLEEEHPVEQELNLVSCFHGELVLLTPENVHKLYGEDAAQYLNRELDRLAAVLPLGDFLCLLTAMRSEEHPDDISLADGVLENRCVAYRDMLGDVR